MKRFTYAGRQAIQADNLYGALSLALMMPDICGSLEDPGPNRSKQRYLRWFTKWSQPKFLGPLNMPLISADDCYQIRCSIIHSGSAEIEPGRQSALDRFIFFDKTAKAHLILCDITANGVPHKFLQLRADLFSEAMFEAADEWDAAVASDTKIQGEKAKLLVIQSSGYTIGGGAMRFG